MSIKKYRAILEKSNPRIVREFQIDDGRSYQELVQTLALICGWDTNDTVVYSALDKKQSAVPLRTPIRRAFASAAGIRESSQNPVLRVSFPCRHPYTKDTVNFWTFRLEELPDDTVGDEEPKLIWSRGSNPLSQYPSVASWNEFHYKILANDPMPVYGENGVYSAGQLKPDMNRINRRLNLRIKQKRPPVTIDRSHSRPLQTVLEGSTLKDLKELIRKQGLTTSPNQKKAGLVRDLAEELNTEKTWKAILDEMDLKEYEEFTKICTGHFNSQQIRLHTLQMRCMIRCDSYWGDDRIPTELIDYFEEIAEQGEDDELLKIKRYANVLEVCSLLYGVFSRSQAVLIANRMYPGEFSPSDIDKVWKPGSSRELIQPDVMYRVRNLTEDDARTLFRQLESGMIPYYTPSQAELLRLSSDGFTFPADAEKIISKHLRPILSASRYSEEEAPYLASMIYELYHLGWDRVQIEKMLREQYSFSSDKSLFRTLFDAIERHSDDISMVSLRGHSVNSLKKLRPRSPAAPNTPPQPESPTRAASKIYPNSPCPCGSGKKYKYCHGKKN